MSNNKHEGAVMGRGRAEKTKAMALRMSEERRHQLNLIAKLLPGRHTMTSVLEWSLDVAIAETPELSNVIKTWSPHESDRFVLTADAYPQTVTHDEKMLWDFIQSRREFWLIKPVPGVDSVTVRPANQPPAVDRDQLGFNYRLLRDTWNLITAHVIDGQPWDEAAFADIAKAHGLNPASPLTAHVTHAPKETQSD